MSKVVFYRQLRMDGGYRTGLEVDEETVYGLFEEGQTDDDPRLRWFVDLRCVGSKLAKSARLARAWLLKNSPTILDGFARCSQEVRAGIDPDLYAISWADFKDVPEDIQMTIVFTAARRADAIGMAEVLAYIGSNWERLVRMLKPVRSARS
ncbi:MAG: hypothetical protein ACXU95_03155 [Isosphaeraceae bacterium]|jgi:hypothetical protein